MVLITTASIRGRINEYSLVISNIINIADIGIELIPPSIAPIPTKTKVVVSKFVPQIEFTPKEKRNPIHAPMNKDGANKPPNPPE